MTQLTWYVIYKTTHVETDQFYVGRHQTTNLDDGYQGSGNWVRSFDDTSVLQTEIVEYCEDAEHLREREQHYIDLWFDDELCMNVSRMADGLHEQTEEAKQAIAASLTGRKHDQETISKISAARKGCSISPEQREKISATMTGKKLSPKHRQAMADGWSNEQREKQRLRNVRHFMITDLQSGATSAVCNLKKWASENNCSVQKLHAVASGRQGSHKGLTCQRITKTEYDALLAA